MLEIDILAIAASVVFLARLLPQPIHLARRGVAAGVSPVAALNAVVSAVAWIVYGLSAHLFVVWSVSVLALVPCVWQSVLLRRQITGRVVASAALFAASLAVAGVLGVLGLALAGTVVVTVGPQVHRAVTEEDLSGISPATYWVALVDATAWGLYGLAIHDVPLVGYWLVLGTFATIILARLSWTGRMARSL